MGGTTKRQYVGYAMQIMTKYSLGIFQVKFYGKHEAYPSEFYDNDEAACQNGDVTDIWGTRVLLDYDRY